jgi:opacity protein-like surface antigen
MGMRPAEVWVRRSDGWSWCVLWVTLALLSGAAARADDGADAVAGTSPRPFTLLDDAAGDDARDPADASAVLAAAAEIAATDVEPSAMLAAAALELDDASTDAAPAPDTGHHLFDQGTWALQFRGSWFEDYNNSNVTYWSGAVALAYYIDDRLAINAELAGYDIESGYPEDIEVQMGSFTLQLRYHFLVRDRYSLYLDGGAGVRMADNRFPNYPSEERRGTRFGFVLRGGGGLTFRLTDHTHIFVGGEWHHVSNGHDKPNNPPTDGINIYTGLMFTW